MTVVATPRRRTRATSFDYQPDQLRVPRGNGKVSGRWLDGPGAILDDIATIGNARRHAALSVDLRPATDAHKAEFKRRFGKSIPPQWTDVHVDFGEGAELIARGRDKAGRQQSLYTDAYHEKQSAAKYERIVQVHERLPDIDAALATIDGDHTKAVARLMHVEGIRVGSTEKQQGKVMAYGASTLKIGHAERLENGNIRLAFTAKEGIPAEYEIDDPELVKFISDRLALGLTPQDPLFETNADKTIALLREISGLPGIKNHDLRTLLANRIAHAEVMKLVPPPPGSKREVQMLRKRVAEIVARQLRNKPTQALSSYINPAVFAPLLEAI